MGNWMGGPNQAAIELQNPPLELGHMSQAVQVYLMWHLGTAVSWSTSTSYGSR
jgi:hypothetical protein